MTWREYLQLSPGKRAEPSIIALLDPKSQTAARIFYHSIPAEKRRRRAQMKAWVDSVTEAEIAVHCQFPPEPDRLK